MHSLKRFKQTLSVRALGWWKIPLIALVRPQVVEMGDDRCVIRIPLRRRTRNHLGSMYFGALPSARTSPGAAGGAVDPCREGEGIAGL
jgi:hypothetical protein